jgi:hypothetical protein
MTVVRIGKHDVYLSDPDKIPDADRTFIGRKAQLASCRAAWGIGANGKQFDNRMFRLNFRLQGPPGVGKNEIVYETIRHVAVDSGIPFYMIQGHEELTPEDLALVLVPDSSKSTAREIPLVVRASPLATAIYEGGLFFFDEINRVPERSLSPLASVLDSRQYLYSAMTGLKVEPKDEEARQRFRFCCALNPKLSETGRGVLPEYIEQRTLPVIDVGYPPFEDLCEIILENLKPKPDAQLLEEFTRRFGEGRREDMSVRQALSLMMYVLNYLSGGSASGTKLAEAFDRAEQGAFLDGTD